VSYCLDTNFLVSILFDDAHTARAFAWLERVPEPIYVSDWAAAELFALIHRRARAGVFGADVASAALLEFEGFAGTRARRLWHSSAAGALAALLARDPALKLSAADALHLALSADGGHCLVTFDSRLAEAARTRGLNCEIPQLVQDF
jgi:predicted nucleic acid-binding protein